MTVALALSNAARELAPGGKLFDADVAVLNRAAAELSALWAARKPAEGESWFGGSPTASAPTSRSTGLKDERAFFAVIREGLHPLNDSQVQGFQFLLGKMAAVAWPVSWVAYALATAWHETAERMQPVREGLDVSDAWRRRNLRYYPHYGRGYPQTTWPENYAKADEKLGLGGTLIANPDRMLEPDIAAATMIRGMEEGWFAGDKAGRHTLARHFPDRSTSTRAQKLEGRRIINGTDKRDKIADEAEVIERALRAGEWQA